MATHLYNSRLGKIRWFIRRFGAREIFLKPLRIALAPWILPRLPRRTLAFQEQTLPYFYHRYNMTWANERCVEIPLGRFYLQRFAGRRILEVGNVLSHYGPVQHTVLDKYERGAHILNQDIVEYCPDQPYHLVLSISTFEHIGFDDTTEETSAEKGAKILAAIRACRAMLTTEGRLVLTLPLGYNPELDQLVRDESLGADRSFYFHRPQKNLWQACEATTAQASRYATPFPYANALLVAEFAPESYSC